MGRLTISQVKESRTLWFEAGQVRAVVSDLEEEKLGAWLVSRGFLKPHEMALALLRQPERVRFGTFLVMQRMLDFDRLTAELSALSVKQVSRMLFAPATYVFTPGELLPRDAVSLEMTTASLLVAAVRAVDDFERVDALVPSGSYLWGAQDALLQYQHVQLLPQEGYLLSRIDGQTTATVLQRLMPLPKETVTRALAALVVAGLAEVHAEPMPRPEEAVPAAGVLHPVAATPPPIAPMTTPPRDRQSVARPVLRPASTPSRAPTQVPVPAGPRPPQAPAVIMPSDLPAELAAVTSWSFEPTAGFDGVAAPGAPATPGPAPSVPVAAPSAAAFLAVGGPGAAAQSSHSEVVDDGLEFRPEQEYEHAAILRFAAECRGMEPAARLGVSPGVTQEELLAAFRELVKKYHPDRANEPHLKMLRSELAEISSALLEAYDALRLQARSSGPVIVRATQGGPRPIESFTNEERRQAVHEKVTQARRLLRQGDTAQAAELLDLAVRLAPDAKTLLFLARVEFHNPIWVQRGLDRLRHAVSLDPHFTEGWLELANYWGTRAQPDKQRQCLEKILAYDPRNEDVRAALMSVTGALRSRKR